MPSAIVPRCRGNPMCGQRLSTAWTSPPSAMRHRVWPFSATTSLPRSRTSASDAARTDSATSVTAIASSLPGGTADSRRSLELQVRFKSSACRRADHRRARGPQRGCFLCAEVLRERRPDPVRADEREPTAVPAGDPAPGRAHPGRQGGRYPARADWGSAPNASGRAGPEPARLGAPVTPLARGPRPPDRDARGAPRPAHDVHRVRLPLDRPLLALEPGRRGGRARRGRALALARPGLERVALFRERVGVIVVAVPLPETGLVDPAELDPAQPLRALPEVLARYDETKGPTVLRRQRLAVGMGCEERERILEGRERDIRREAL